MPEVVRKANRIRKLATPWWKDIQFANRTPGIWILEFGFFASIMTSTILHPPAHLPPSVALQLSQQAPIILQNTPISISPYSISSLYAPAETADLWTTYENLMQSCLRTGDEQSAHVCLERLTSRFGSENERVMALRGLFQEAIAEDDAALQCVLEEYDSILARDQTNMV